MLILMIEKAVQGGRGAQLKIPLISSSEEHLLSFNHTKYAATLQGERLSSISIEKPYALIVGNEGHGVSKGLIKRAKEITIPLQNMESLNVATATAILLYHAECQ